MIGPRPVIKRMLRDRHMRRASGHVAFWLIGSALFWAILWWWST